MNWWSDAAIQYAAKQAKLGELGTAKYPEVRTFEQRLLGQRLTRGQKCPGSGNPLDNYHLIR